MTLEWPKYMYIFVLNHYITGGNVRIPRDRDKSEGFLAVHLDPIVSVQDDTKQTLISAFLKGN